MQAKAILAVDVKLKKITTELKTMVTDGGSTRLEIHGVGRVGAARILAAVADVTGG